MNTWLYLMLIYSISITYTNLQGIEITPLSLSTEYELPSEFYSAEETDLNDDKTNGQKHFFENTKSILQSLPDIANEIAVAIVSDIDKNVTPNLPKDSPITWGVLNNLITNLKKQIPNVNVSCSFKRSVAFYTINVKFNSIFFGTKIYIMLADRERRLDEPDIDEDKSDDE
ncbi:Hypothetical protein CINCED_3A011655, partial [Cinara cedri]